MKTHARKRPAQQSLPDIEKSNATPLSAGRTVDSILYLQRTIGNRAVQRLLREDGEALEAGRDTPPANRSAHVFSRASLPAKAPATLQAKLKVNTPGDAYEQEADRVAERVTSMPEERLQRSCSCSGGCSKCGNEQAVHEHLQTKHLQPNGAEQAIAPPIVNEALRSSGQPLDPRTREFMESRFGYDFSRVRVHADERAAESVRAVSARAYTVGHHVVFGTGQNAPTTNEGRKLLAHELTHVLQQQTDNASSSSIDMHAEGAAVQRQIFDKGPTGKSDPLAIIPIENFIKYVEAVEKAYPTDSPTDIVTRIRQQYYSGLAFDLLIPYAHIQDTHMVETDLKPIAVTERRLIDQSIGDEAYKHLTARANENTLGDNPSPYVQLAGGEKVDVGHLLLGLDALLHPATSKPFTSYEVPNIDPSTYVADLGIASVLMSQHELSVALDPKRGEPPSDAPVKLKKPDLDAYFKMSAPTEDLLGDVDPFGVHAQWVSTPGQPLSQILRAYYLGGTGQKAGVKKRWQTFCAKNGFTYKKSGTTIEWLPTVRAELVKRVDNFSSLYGAGKLGSVVGALTIPIKSKWPYTGLVVDRFLNWVKSNLEKELASEPK